jgi:hypothetical protein
MGEVRIAQEDVWRDDPEREGLRWLVAAKGQPLPDGYEESKPAVKRQDAPVEDKAQRGSRGRRAG